MLDLEELKRLLEKATPGPWRLGDGDPMEICQMGLAVMVCNMHAPHSNQLALADAELITALRNAAPQLIQEIEALREYYDARELPALGRQKVALKQSAVSRARSRVEAIRRGK